MASSTSLPGVRMVTPTGRPATRSSSGSSTASRSRARRASPPAPIFSTRRSATPRPAIAASQAQPFPPPQGYVPPRPRAPPAGGAWRSAVVGPAVLLLFVGGGDGAGDQGRRHVTVGEDPVVEAAEVEGVAQAGLGGGAEAFQLQAADQVAEGLGRGHGVAGHLGAGGGLLKAGHRAGAGDGGLVAEVAG